MEGNGYKGCQGKGGKETGKEEEGEKVRTLPPSIPAYDPAFMCLN